MENLQQSRAYPVSPADPHPRRQFAIHAGRTRVLMSYVDEGQGMPIVFLHGNPSSSYLWRNIIPHVVKQGRCLAPDLMGMGHSGKLPDGRYSFLDQSGYLDEWFSGLGLESVHLVLHDWGSALGFYWASRNASKVRSITYMESIVQPRKWVDFPPGRDGFFRALRSEKGEGLIFDDNFFIETIVPKSVLRSLSPEEMEAYRKPFEKKEDRLPTLIFPRQLPIEGEPAEIVRIVERYGNWLSKSTIPKLLIVAEPGSLLVGEALAFCRTWPNQREILVRGIHFIQEDSPEEIGSALSDFLAELGD